MSDSNTPKVLDDVLLAQELSVSVHFLRKDRRGRRIIPFFKIGGCVRYDLDRVRAALIAREEGGVQSTKRVRA